MLYGRRLISVCCSAKLFDTQTYFDQERLQMRLRRNAGLHRPQNRTLLIVRPLSSNISKNCALCDKSTKFGTDVNYYNTKFFRYWATSNFASVSAILDFKMAAIKTLKMAIFLDPSQIHMWYWWLNIHFGVTEFNTSTYKWLERHSYWISTRKPSCRWQTSATRKHAKNRSNSTCLQRCWCNTGLSSFV